VVCAEEVNPFYAPAAVIYNVGDKLVPKESLFSFSHMIKQPNIYTVKPSIV